MIYLDNAATTYKKPARVYRVVNKAIRKYAANPGRSSHRLALKATEIIYDAREVVSNFFGLNEPENVIFTQNATYALNIAIKGMINRRCHVIISDLEHNSVLRPINALCDSIGIEYSVFRSGTDNVFKEIESLIRPDTAFVITTLASNVTGKEIPLLALSEIKKRYNIGLIIDASQLAGHKRIDLSRYAFDAFVAPGHKALFGIMGGGFCIFSSSAKAKTIIDGGSGSESVSAHMPEKNPERFEAGTLALPAIASIAEGIRFIEKRGIERVEEEISVLTNRLKEMLCGVRGINIYGGENGVLSFTLDGMSTEGVSAALDKKGICTRAGLHCAPLAHKTYGTLDSGTVRISVSCLNTVNDIEKAYEGLLDIRRRS
ncbi:MAG: aminotransferase class V-fold PLP-dependent enzyme [Clostridia bacterium]|nr:aminotransferase class V-fold PLP-dependent enzyme [Clostridia bacterium]